MKEQPYRFNRYGVSIPYPSFFSVLWVSTSSLSPRTLAFT